MKALSVSGLTKEYAQFKLDNISFDVEEGHIVGFIGRNGAGKSTTLKGIMNFISGTGVVKVFEKEFASSEQEIKQEIGFVSGGFEFYPFKTLAKIAKAYSNFYPNWNAENYKNYLKAFNLDENKKVSELSSGMKVKFSLALALSHGAKLLIMDEPTSGLDPISRDEFCDIILSLSKQNVSILFSTHITSDLMKVADDIVYISNGKVLADCELKSLLDKYYLVHFQTLDEANDLEVIGLKMVKNGYDGLMKKENCQTILNKEEPTLDDIMIHLEKENINK